jgi:multisubunit Na+/H+ antiporter MnhE subunit
LQIEHDPGEPGYDRNRSPFVHPWPAGFVMLAIMWGLFVYSVGFEWPSIVLGLLTGMLVTAWFFDCHGTESPKSWRNSGRNGRS